MFQIPLKAKYLVGKRWGKQSNGSHSGARNNRKKASPAEKLAQQQHQAEMQASKPKKFYDPLKGKWMQEVNN